MSRKKAPNGLHVLIAAIVVFLFLTALIIGDMVSAHYRGIQAENSSTTNTSDLSSGAVSVPNVPAQASSTQDIDEPNVDATDKIFFKILSDYNSSQNPPFIPVTNITVIGQVGDFAFGSANEMGPEAFGWIMKKIDGTWQVIFVGNGETSCSTVTEYDIPQAVYGQCVP